MDWTELGLGNHIVAWLERAATDRYARARRLDPFATSMRDFDDVSSDLQHIRNGHEPRVNDPLQRLTDLRNAGLVVEDRVALTDLGAATLQAWEKYGVATGAIGDELARHLLLVLEARRIGNEQYEEYLQYWRDLRTYFNGLALIANWNILYALNYLDYPFDGFAPGSVFRDEAVPVRDVDIDLASYAQRVSASAMAVAGANRIQRAIRDQIPRGRHRSTFCMALEMAVSEGQHALFILDRFGLPVRPLEWTRFDSDQKAKIVQILQSYGAARKETFQNEAAAERPSGRNVAEGAVSDSQRPTTLPAEIDFSVVKVERPNPSARTRAGEERRPRTGKVNGVQKARANDATGKLGEEFAIRYERWRLRDHPDLLKQVQHVSKEDDTIGYDIQSFELDGSPRFVEVKGTLGPIESRFFISANELDCAMQKAENYVILRVAQLSDNPICCEIRFPFENKLDLVTSTYSVTFSPRKT